MSARVRIRCDARPLLDAIRTVAVPASDPEVADGLLDSFQLSQEVVLVQLDPRSAPAGEVIVRLEPSDRLRRLAAAAGAGNV